MVEHQVRIPRLEGFDSLSTDLDKPPWDQAARLTGNFDWRRIRTADLPVTTWLFYDRQALWMAYRWETTRGKDLRANIRERDADLKKEDHFNLEMDVGPTGRVFYRFVVNPLGTLYDSVIIDKTWNSTAQIRTATDETGWTAVMRIPFSDFGRSEPAADSFWTFNISTRSGFDNCWAPVLGGYHAPEQFARLIFAGDETPVVRMLDFRPLRIGANTMRVDCPPGTLWQWEAVDQETGVLSQQAGQIGSNGELTVDLIDDRIDHVNFEFRDPKGKVLLSFWRPAEIPEILSRLPELHEKLSFVRQHLEKLPKAIRPQTSELLSNAADLLTESAASSPDEWASLHERLGRLERQITDAWLYAHTLIRLSPSSPYALAAATPMDKVMIRDHPCPGRPADHYEVSLARNEHEAMQLVVIPVTRALKQVSVTASPAIAEGGAKFNGTLTTALVGHVKTRPAGSYLPDYVGWYPDPILHFQNSCDIAVGEHVAFWIDVSTTADAVPGEYKSTLTVTAAGCEPIRVPLQIRVWHLDLPPGTHLRNAFTYNEPNAKRLYKERWSDELSRLYHDFILDHRLNIDSLYGKHDREVELIKHGAARGMNAFNLFYVGKGASPDVVRRLLEERMPALKEAGLDRIAYLYGFDEVNDETFPRMREVFGLVGSLYPDLPRMTTGYDNTFGRTTGLRDYVDIWVPLIPEYDVVEAERLRAEGNDIWWYLCVGPRHPYPNWFVESPAIEARLLMGAMSYKYRVGGVLYFMMNGWSLNDQPISAGPCTNWFPGAGKSRDGVYANGDGSIFCAGPDGPVTTIRLENIRDGLEDYEYLYILAETAGAVAKKSPTLARRAYLQRASDLLRVPDTLVRSSSRYTRDPRNLYAVRDVVVQAIGEGRALLRD